MITILDKTKCCGCSACVNICPKKCIDVQSDKEGFLYPVTKFTECIGCGLCEFVCPVTKANAQPKDGTILAAFGGNTKDEQLRKKSSSGGIFGVLAKNVLSENGVVFGADFSDDYYSVQHVCIENSTDLHILQGSKYLQSEIRSSYKKTKEFLNEGRLVMFTGTPCQIAGLNAYLGKGYDNLFTQDVICHGVPSPMIWERYARHREQIAGGTIQRISFRHKKYGWETYLVLFEFSNNTRYVKKLSDDPYMQMFLRNIDLRPSCYDCAFRNGTSGSDITLADYWGVQSENPELNDDKGTSLIIIHTQKGLNMFQKIQSDLNFRAIDFERAIRHNLPYYKSVQRPEKREQFFNELQDDSIDKVMRKYAPPMSFIQKVKNKINGFVKRKIKR